MKVIKLVFSPTGTSQQVADALAKGLGQDIVSVDLCDISLDPASVAVGPEDICVIAAPVYGGRIPAVAAGRIAAVKGNGAAAVLAAVYGNRHYDDALVELYDLAIAAGFKPCAGVTAVAEHNIARRVAAGRPDADDKAQLEEYGRKIIAAAPWGGELTLPGNRPYKQTKGGGGPKPQVGEGCISCGICAQRCPVGAIPAEAPNTTDMDKCMGCQRCIAICPVGARALDPAVAAGSAQRLEAMCAQPRPNELYL